MAYILDTHVLLWTLDEENRLSTIARDIISNVDSVCFISTISFFEMAIKQKIGKLGLTKAFSEYAREAKRLGFILLPIALEHIENYEKIPLNEDHRDPFDRLIIATALHEKLKIISADEKFSKYNRLVEIVW